MNRFESEYNRGLADMRDIIICSIIGFQNEIWNSESIEYQTYQKMHEYIENRFGGLMKQVKF